MIGFIDTLFIQFGTAGNTALSLFYTLSVHHYTCTRVLNFTSRILATDFDTVVVAVCNFKTHMKPSFHSLIHFLPLFCNCQFRRLNSIQFLSSQAHILAGSRLETRLSSILLCAAEHFFVTTLHGPRRKQPLLLRSHVY
jgi:hypothetical protein